VIFYMHVFHDLECLRLRGGARCTCNRATALTDEQSHPHYHPLSNMGYSGHPWDGSKKEAAA